MTNEEQKEKYREWLFGLANEGCETKFLANVKVFEGKQEDGTPFVKAYINDDDYFIFTPMEWFKMYQLALGILRSIQLSFGQTRQARGILEQIERDNPNK